MGEHCGCPPHICNSSASPAASPEFYGGPCQVPPGCREPCRSWASTGRALLQRGENQVSHDPCLRMTWFREKCVGMRTSAPSRCWPPDLNSRLRQIQPHGGDAHDGLSAPRQSRGIPDHAKYFLESITAPATFAGCPHRSSAIPSCPLSQAVRE